MESFVGSKPRGWLFAEDFDLPTADPPAGTEPEFIAPVYSLADLDAARAEAAAAARTAALAESAARDSALAASACARIADALTASTEQVAALAETVARPLATAVLAALRAALPDLFAHHGTRETAALIARIAPALRCVPRASVSLDPASLPVIAALPAIAAIDPARLTLRADPALTAGELTITWQDGGLSRDLGALLAEIDQLLELSGFLETHHGR